MADLSAARFKSRVQDWETPLALFTPLNEEFQFTIDVCATDENKKVPCYFSETADGLRQDWGAHRCWMNPPFKQQKRWVEKAYQAAMKGALVVCLLPARTNTNWWHDYCMKGEVRFIKGRPKFGGAKHGLPLPLAIVIFRPGIPTKGINDQTTPRL